MYVCIYMYLYWVGLALDGFFDVTVCLLCCVLCRVVPCCVVLCFVVLCCAVLCCDVLLSCVVS